MAPMTGISLAGNAIQNSLPGGVIFYAAYVFRQYRRFGADDVLAGWTLVAVNALSFISLSAVAAVGLGMALGAGSALDLVEVILGIVVVAVMLVLAWVERARLLPHLARVVGLSQRFIRRPSPTIPAEQVIDGWLTRVGAVGPSRTDWVWASGMSLGNWVADCGCLALCFLAVGAGVPWRGLLLAYGAGQLATILPITPGRARGRRGQPDGRPGHLRRGPELHRGGRTSVPAHVVLVARARRVGGVGGARPHRA